MSCPPTPTNLTNAPHRDTHCGLSHPPKAGTLSGSLTSQNGTLQVLAPLVLEGRFPILDHHFIHDAVGLRFKRTHEEISVGIFFNSLQGLTGVLRDHLVEARLEPQNFTSLD